MKLLPKSCTFQTIQVIQRNVCKPFHNFPIVTKIGKHIMPKSYLHKKRKKKPFLPHSNYRLDWRINKNQLNRRRNVYQGKMNFRMQVRRLP